MAEKNYDAKDDYYRSMVLYHPPAPVKGEANIRAIENMANIKADPEETEKELREIFHLDNES